MSPTGYLAFPRSGNLPAFVARAADAFGLAPDVLSGPNRCHPIVDYRQCAMAAARELGWTHQAIGDAFGRRHYSTVINAVQRVGADDELTWTAMALVLAEKGRSCE